MGAMRLVWLVLLDCVVTADSRMIGILLHMLIGLFLPNSPPYNEVVPSDVKFFLATRRNRDQRIELNQSNYYAIDYRNPIKMIIHGWLENGRREWIRNMTREFLRKGDYNVIQVDYERPAAEKYAIVVNHIKAVGGLVGDLLATLYANFRVPLANIHLIGHSLGAHVSGHAGKQVTRLTGEKIYRITALDAAGPLFEIPPFLTVEGLQRTDAQILDAIHTDGGIFGYRRSLGTVDFFPNGGGPVQPNCPVIPLDAIVRLDFQRASDEFFCSHQKSYFYYIKSINSIRFESTKCNSWNDFRAGMCNSNVKSLMGDNYTYSPEATGNFYLRVGVLR